MVEYNKINVKLPDLQLNKLKSAVKNQTGVTLRMNMKMFEGNDLPHELLLATIQNTKLRKQCIFLLPGAFLYRKQKLSKIIAIRHFQLIFGLL